MHADFGLLVDFLRGELSEAEAASVRARLENENEEAFFAQFERLRRTYAVLRSMPALSNVEGPLVNRESGVVSRELPDENIPLTEPRPEFVADVRREYQSRGLASLIPHIAATAAYIKSLRMEFCVRAICACLPGLRVSQSLLQALRVEFAARARMHSLPFIAARPAWIAALRKGFVLRSLAASLPLLEPRAEWVAALRAEFAQRALVGSLPVADVRGGFGRRLKVALVESGRAAEPAEALRDTSGQAPALPAVEANDPFRRRLFRKLKLSSRRSVREEPRRVDLAEHAFGRQLAGELRTGRRSVAFTFAVHGLAIVILLFVFIRADVEAYNPLVAIGESNFAVVPELPGAQDEFVPGKYSGRTTLPAPYAEDWSSSGEDMPLGLGGDSTPDRELRTQDEAEAAPTPLRTPPSEESLAYLEKENIASFFRMRGSSPQQKIDYLGSEELYEALDKTLAWLARAQQLNPDADGSWGWVGVDPRMISRLVDLREVQQLEMTSAALLAFLGDGHSSEKSPVPEYSFAVKRGVNWLLSKQRSDGQIGPPEQNNVLVHAMATLALAEEFGLTRRADLREPLRRACRWLCDVKSNDSAGFPFKLNGEASMSTSVWAYMALATARNVKVPPIDLPQQRIDDFLDWYEGQTNDPTSVLADTGPVLGHELLADASAAAMCQFTLEADRDYTGRRNDMLPKINRHLPDLDAYDDKRDNGDVRYLFFGSQANALNLQRTGRKSNEWYNAFTRTLLKNQKDDGTWACTSQYSSLYGDVYTAAMACLSIENAYRVSIIK